MYYNADPNRQPILLGMLSGITNEFKNKNQTAKGGSISNAWKGATSEKTNRRLRQQMVFLQQLKSVLPTCLLPPVREVGGGASAVQHAVLQEDAELRRIVEEENLHKNGTIEPPPLDPLQLQTMRDQDRIPHRVPKAERIPCRGRGMVVTFCPDFSVDSISTRRGAACSR